MGKVLLCTHREALMHPEVMGLGEVSFEALEWLTYESDPEQARAAAAAPDIDEIWVEGSDGVEAMNLAAAICADQGRKPVLVVAQDASGSLRSRAQAAGVNGVLSYESLLRRISLEKERRARMAEAVRDLEASLDATLAVHSREEALGQIEVAADMLEEPHAQPRRAEATSSESAEMAASAERASAVPRVDCDSSGKRPSGQAYLLTVLSGSGGAGKSAISAVAAAAAAAKGYKTLLFDCDLQFGDTPHLMGVPQPTTADDVLADPERFEALAEEAEPNGVALLAPPPKLEQAEVVAAHLPQILDAAAALFDVIVVNTGASWSECQAVLIEQSDCSLFLVDQKASSVRACRHAVGLCERLGIATANFEYAVNRCGRGAPFTGIDVGCALQGAHVFEIKDGGPDVEELLGTGSMGDLMGSKNDLCLSVSAMLDELLPAGGKKARRGIRKAVGQRAKGETASRRRRRRRGGAKDLAPSLAMPREQVAR